MVLADSRAVNLGEPIRVGALQLSDVLRRVLLDGRRELRRVQHGGKPGHLRRRHAARVLDLRRPRPAGFRLDDHDAVGSVCPIDRRSLAAFEHRDALDVVRVQEVEGVAPAGREPAAGADRQAVDHIERIAARVDRGRAANPDGHAAARLVVVDHLHSGNLALDELLGADDAAGIELLR